MIYVLYKSKCHGPHNTLIHFTALPTLHDRNLGHPWFVTLAYPPADI